MALQEQSANEAPKSEKPLRKNEDKVNINTNFSLLNYLKMN